MNQADIRASRHITQPGQKIVRQALLIIVTVMALYPVYWMIVTAFKSHPDYLVNKFGFPHTLHFDNIVVIHV